MHDFGSVCPVVPHEWFQLAGKCLEPLTLGVIRALPFGSSFSAITVRPTYLVFVAVYSAGRKIVYI